MPSQQGRPTARRTVDAMVGMLAARGKDRTQCLQAIALACETVIERNAGNASLDLGWMEDVGKEARRQLQTRQR